MDGNRGEANWARTTDGQAGRQEVACSEVECWRAGNELPGK